MLNLRIFILLVLAGLCFGAFLEEPQSSGDNSQDSGSPPEPQPSAQAEESNKENGKLKEQEQKEEKKEDKVENKEEEISKTNREKEAEASGSKEKEGAGNKESGKEDVETTIQKENHTLGYELPEYIGPLKERGRYMAKLLSACGQSQEYSVNEREIFFHNCTYICVKRGTNLTPRSSSYSTGHDLQQRQREMPW
uniref:Putative cyclic nucleotide-gated cation channel beta-1 n=1 Tax=Ixodes ricinus TaxID=34613 RepID=V5H134_IXORI